MMKTIQTFLRTTLAHAQAIVRLRGRGHEPRFLSTAALRIPTQIRDAIAEQQPVVALESAIITHGMPFPDNIQLALEMEAKLRQKVRDSLSLSWTGLAGAALMEEIGRAHV